MSRPLNTPDNPVPDDPSADYSAPQADIADGIRERFAAAEEQVRGTAFRMLLVRGILALVLGVLLFLVPTMSIGGVSVFIAVLIGVWLLLDGIASIAFALRKRKVGAPQWGWTLAAGIIAVVAAIVAFVFPLATAAVGGLFIMWTLAIGILFQGIAMFGDSHLGGWGIVLGVTNIIFGIIIGVMAFMNPAATLVALIWVAAVYAIVYGIGALVMAFRVRKG